MWASSTPAPGNVFFTDDPRNMQLANDYGIVVSTSHHEPMQRATNEWNASETGPWDWRLNKQNVTRFMEEGIRRMGNNESYVTLGMRGPSDSAIVGDDAINILKEVFQAEREIFEKVLGDRKVNRKACLRRLVESPLTAMQRFGPSTKKLRHTMRLDLLLQTM